MSTSPPPPPPPAAASAGSPAGGAAPSRSFGEAVKVCLRKYVDFGGRASRSEYWYWTLGVVLAYASGFALDLGLGGDGMFAGLVFVIVGLGTLLPGLAAAVRRLHDTGRTGWWLLLVLVPFGVFVLIYFYVQPGDPVTNEYG